MTNFNEYEDFIYLNTHMSREDARKIARDAWNKGMDRYDALKAAKEEEERNSANARERISSEFINRFYSWLDDENNMEDRAYAQKYGWYKNEVHHKDSLASVAEFQRKFYDGMKNLGEWERAGFNLNDIRVLNRTGFLSFKQMKWEGYFYISQKTAKEIYREHKGI